MGAHLFAPGNFPFAVALVLMVGIGILEMIGAVFGGGISSALEDLLPDPSPDVAMDVDAPDLDGTTLEAPGLVSRLLGWLHVGRVPLLVLLVVFLLFFGIGGLLLQEIVDSLLGRMLPGWLAAPAVFAGVLPAVRATGGLLARVLPRDETTSVSTRTFIGRVAVVITGTAARGAPAQAKLHDQHGQVHYVLVEPDVDGDRFPTGAAVLLVSQQGAVFRAIANPSQSLLG
jgi:hypothetical protein